jgi:hypothetical protein
MFWQDYLAVTAMTYWIGISIPYPVENAGE